MKLWETFLYSLKLPNKQAAFKLNRIGMDTTVFYMFILLFIVSIPSLIERITSPSGVGSDMNLVFLLIYFFMFYYLPLVIIVFIAMTITAYLFTWIANWMKRKLKLQLLWKMIAYTSTIPLLIYTLIALFYPVSTFYLLLAILFIVVLLLKIISLYPKRKVRP